MNKAEIGKILVIASQLDPRLNSQDEAGFLAKVEAWSHCLRSSMTFEVAREFVYRHYKNSHWTLMPQHLNERWDELDDYQQQKIQTEIMANERVIMKELSSKMPDEIKEIAKQAGINKRAKRNDPQRLLSDKELAELDAKKQASIMFLQLNDYLEEQSNG